MDHTYEPESWGWKPEFHAAWASEAETNRGPRPLIPARVTGREHHQYEAVLPDFTGRADLAAHSAVTGFYRDIRVSGKFEYGALDGADFPVTGDWVLVDPEEDRLRIHGILPRRSALSRGRAGLRSEEQVLAANLDTLFIVFALDGGRNFLVRLLERGLVIAKNSGVPACIVLNKADIASDEDRERALSEAAYAAPAVPVFALSAKTGEGLDELAAILFPGETVGLLGKSGVGKSALINALGARRGDFPGRDGLAREGRIRDGDLRGRHTTTSSRLYRLDSGLLIIDSPGIRELKIWGDAEGLDGGFPEISELAGRCRFADCAHSGEPGCAVQEALNRGELDPKRYLAFLELSRERAALERRYDERARQADDRKWKQISKWQKELKRNGR
jgi:ribosome biogenesis GTPase